MKIEQERVMNVLLEKSYGKPAPDMRAAVREAMSKRTDNAERPRLWRMLGPTLAAACFVAGIVLMVTAGNGDVRDNVVPSVIDAGNTPAQHSPDGAHRALGAGAVSEERDQAIADCFVRRSDGYLDINGTWEGGTEKSRDTLFATIQSAKRAEVFHADGERLAVLSDDNDSDPLNLSKLQAALCVGDKTRLEPVSSSSLVNGRKPRDKGLMFDFSNFGIGLTSSLMSYRVLVVRFVSEQGTAIVALPQHGLTYNLLKDGESDASVFAKSPDGTFRSYSTNFLSLPPGAPGVWHMLNEAIFPLINSSYIKPLSTHTLEITLLGANSQYPVEWFGKHIDKLHNLRGFRFCNVDNVYHHGKLWPSAIDDAGLRSISLLKGLTRLSITTVEFVDSLDDGSGIVTVHEGVSDKGLEYLKDLPNLEHIELSCTNVYGSGLKHLEDLSLLKSLTVECLDNGKLYRRVMKPEDQEAFGHLPALQEFSFTGLGLSSKAMEGLASSRAATSLVNLSLDIFEPCAEGIATLCRNPNLEQLSLKARGATARDGELVATIDDATLRSVASAENLCELRIEGSDYILLSDASIVEIGQSLQKLKTLRITGVPMKGSSLGDASFAAIAKLPELRKLYIHGWESVSDEGLAALPDDAKIIFLDITGCKGISYGAVEKFAKHFPACRIIAPDGNSVEPTKKGS